MFISAVLWHCRTVALLGVKMKFINDDFGCILMKRTSVALTSMNAFVISPSLQFLSSLSAVALSLGCVSFVCLARIGIILQLQPVLAGSFSFLASHYQEEQWIKILKRMAANSSFNSALSLEQDRWYAGNCNVMDSIQQGEHNATAKCSFSVVMALKLQTQSHLQEGVSDGRDNTVCWARRHTMLSFSG